MLYPSSRPFVVDTCHGKLAPDPVVHNTKLVFS